jgi:hypothetical protein
MRPIREREGPQVRRPVFALRRRRGGRALAGAVAALAGAAVALGLIATASPAGARTATVVAPTLGQVCLAAADAAADEHGVPRAVLRALTRTETGRARGGKLEPWPWTVNMEGAGHWFESRAEAEAYVASERARGARSFDVGCFQINHRWHGEAFASVSAMFDPRANADYAARFMAGLHAETGDWGRAAGFYHSRTPEFFGRYRARFEKIMADAGPDEPRLALGRIEEGAPSAARRAEADHPVFGRRAKRLAQDARRVARPLPSWTEMASVAQSAGGVAVKLSAGGGGGLLRRPTKALID